MQGILRYKCRTRAALGYEKKKEPMLNGSLDFTGTKALCAYMELARLSATYVHTHVLDIYKPTASRMAVRVADGVSGSGAAAAAITEF